MLLLLIVIFAFFAGTLGAVAVCVLLGAERSRVEARLAALAEPPDTGRRNTGRRNTARRSLADEQLDGGWQVRFLHPLLRHVAGWGARLTPAGASGRLRGSLARAGNPAGLGVREFAGLRVLCAGACLLLSLPLCLVLPAPLAGLRPALIGLSLVVGLTLPEALLEQAIRRRQSEIRRALPDMIDLLAVSVEAGMGLDGALARVTEKMRGPLAEELVQVRQETQIGKSRSQALKDMAGRLEIREIKTFTAAVAQAEQLGTSIVPVLRAQSVMARAAKVQRVREQAARLPVTLLFPLIFFVFPAVFVVLLGPSLLRLMTMLGGMK